MNFNALNFKKTSITKEQDVKYVNISGDTMTGNLDVPSLSINSQDIISIIYSVFEQAIPVGTIISSMSPTAPSGYLPMTGQIYLKTDYPALGELISGIGWESLSNTQVNMNTHFFIVDLRGAFLRGSGTNSYYAFVNNSGSQLGGFQADGIKTHSHQYSRDTGTQSTGGLGSSVRDNNSSTSYTTQQIYNEMNIAVGLAETRPFNISINWYIKY